MSGGRQVSPLDRGAETKLIAILTAVGAPLARRQIFDRVDDEFSTEEDLARCLGRLVADGRLVRAMRPRPGKEDEAVYSTPGTSPPPRVQTSAQPAAATVMCTECGAVGDAPHLKSCSKNERENVVAKILGKTRERIITLFKPSAGWISIGEIAESLDLSGQTVQYHLKALVNEGKIHATGTTMNRRYAHVDVKPAGTQAEEEPALEARPRRKPRAKRAGPRNDSAIPPGPSNLPVPAPAAGKINWAIDDEGTVAIRSENATIKLSPDDIAYGVSFLERTQLLWQHRS